MQKTLIPLNVSNEPLNFYISQVKKPSIRPRQIFKADEKKKINKISQKIIQSCKTSPLSNLRMQTNRVTWIKKIFKIYPKLKIPEINYLLNDFSQPMFTAMRKKDRYNILISKKNWVILCHTLQGEKTITPNIKTVDRLMDVDNIRKVIAFENAKSGIIVHYVEDFPTKFITDYLGLSDSKTFSYLGGKNRIVTNVHGISISFNFTDEKFIDFLQEEEIFSFKNNKLCFKNPITQFPITNIWVGKKHFSKFNNFYQDFKTRNLELQFYISEYKKISRMLELPNYPIYDDKDCILRNDKKLLEKSNSDFDIIFCNQKILLRASYCEFIVEKIDNHEKIKLFHAGTKLSIEPLKIGTIEIYNSFRTTKSLELIQIFNKGFTSDSFELILFAIFTLMAHENYRRPISYLFIDLAKNLIQKENFQKNFSKIFDFETPYPKLSKIYREMLQLDIGSNIRDLFPKIEINENLEFIDQDDYNYLKNKFKGCIRKAQINKWLNNFQLEEIPYMLKLLKQFTIINNQELKERLEKIHKKMLETCSGSLKDTIFFNFGEEGKSANLIQYHYSKSNSIPNSINFIDITKITDFDIYDGKNFFYVDDILGSGDQFIKNWNKFENKLKSSTEKQEFEKFLLKNSFYYSSIIIQEEAKKKIEEDTPFKTIITKENLLKKQDIPFENLDGLFSKEEVSEILNISTKYGKKLNKTAPLGYGNLKLLIAFEHNFPNNTLPIFWMKNSYWKPLIERN
ncbi:hypothetical protein DSAG12_00611 [Promethearchaeum syntrophicum]|uniref:PRTase-CE domain-containing protein n=1 Tax=Promethearchaeum syntrophicum TaxID=2594042 RepID=A0A5B9D6R5_9ARCH|nr:hypothetical protein [Candidatus Prometheoarchaeum syntrophicum]QEE14794.1 hypothetical protein DSAG12_00611 [Candidatus Prometheoarchaeum syntrophicum]